MYIYTAPRVGCSELEISYQVDTKRWLMEQKGGNAKHAIGIRQTGGKKNSQKSSKASDPFISLGQEPNSRGLTDCWLVFGLFSSILDHVKQNGERETRTNQRGLSLVEMFVLANQGKGMLSAKRRDRKKGRTEGGIQWIDILDGSCFLAVHQLLVHHPNISLVSPEGARSGCPRDFSTSAGNLIGMA